MPRAERYGNLTELMKRDLPADLFVELLLNTGSSEADSIDARADHMLSALYEVDRMASLDKYLEPALETYTGVGIRGDKAAAEFFRRAGLICSPGVEPI